MRSCFLLSSSFILSYFARQLPSTPPHLVPVRRPLAAHPGELATAERFCRAAQLRLLQRGLPESAVDGLEVVAVAHTSPEAFAQSHPVLLQFEAGAGVGGGCWVGSGCSRLCFSPFLLVGSLLVQRRAVATPPALT